MQPRGERRSAWARTTTQGVILRSTAARSAAMNLRAQQHAWGQVNEQVGLARWQEAQESWMQL
jgi:hypothetical protein